MGVTGQTIPTNKTNETVACTRYSKLVSTKLTSTNYKLQTLRIIHGCFSKSN